MWRDTTKSYNILDTHKLISYINYNGDNFKLIRMNLVVTQTIVWFCRTRHLYTCWIQLHSLHPSVRELSKNFFKFHIFHIKCRNQSKLLWYFKIYYMYIKYEGWGLSHDNYFLWQDWLIMKKHRNIQMEVDGVGALECMDNADFEKNSKWQRWNRRVYYLSEITTRTRI